MNNYMNYLLTIIGLGMIIISLFLIFSDRLKGEGLYFDLYVKEQEIRKAISDADELIDELKYTSEAVINEIEHNIVDFKNCFKEIKTKEIDQPIIHDISKENAGFLINKYDADKEGKIIQNNRKADTVYKYFDEGLDIGEIAKKLDIGKGEVSLILSLRNGVVKNGNV